MELIWKLAIPAIVILSIIAIGIIICVEERSDARHHLKDKESKR